MLGSSCPHLRNISERSFDGIFLRSQYTSIHRFYTLNSVILPYVILKKEKKEKKATEPVVFTQNKHFPQNKWRKIERVSKCPFSI